MIKPGQQTTVSFPYHMGPGMGGKHHFQVLVKTNDPAAQQLVFEVYANSVDAPAK
ncbi:MAG TPA: hypothetical protein VK464_01590 [Symbiobacteriaceae bacterium]|nr:hypothetical protein [Symbiobacteriaceae bacterium]